MVTKVVVPTLKDTVDEFRSQLRRTITNPTIAGYRPLPQQTVFHQSQKHGKIFLGGNRAGKTVAGATEMVMRLTGQHPYRDNTQIPFHGRAIGSSFEDGVKKIIQPEVKKWLPPSMLKKGSWEASYDLSAKTLTLENGSFLEFLTYDQDILKHAGTSRHGVWFDEEPPEDIFNENMLRLVDVNGDWWLTMTPLLDMSWTYDRLYQKGLSGENPNIEVFQAATLDNTYIDPDVLDILTQGMDDEEKDARKRGTYYNLSGGIYSATLSQDNFIDPIIGSARWPIYYNTWAHFGMLDHGYTNPTAFHLGCVDLEGRIVIYYEYTSTKTLVRDNAKAILEIIKELGLEEKLEYIVADPSIRNTDPISGSSIHNEYAENGLFLVLGNNDVRAGISRMNAMLKENLLLITSNNKNLIKEIPNYRWAKYASNKLAQRKNPQEAPVKKGDHSLDAVRYGVMSRPAYFEPAPPARMGNVLNAPEMIDSEKRMDMDLLMVPYKTFDHPGIFDDVLGTDY